MSARIIKPATQSNRDGGQLLNPPYKCIEIPQPSSSSSSSWSLLSSTSNKATEHTSFKFDPPNYNDPSHPWTVDPDQQDEDEEFLPPYHCTVSHAGKVYLKMERENPHILSKKRSWNMLYVVLWGTQLRAYKRRPKCPKDDDTPLWSHSMEDVQVGLATDYRKYPHVVRIRIREGPQFLIRCCTHGNALLWIDTIQASALVSTDLDTRSMPVFPFNRRRRSRLILPSS
ncbi:hypothetical protein BX666DRAFT_1903832 [Dichotomocladium elegans]|nr:hypothetical protein BX666DRAFT_1903832 [Dichotomocladium elegans]